MKTALVALSLLFVTLFSTTARAQQYSGFGEAAYFIGGAAVLISVPVSMTVTSLVLDGIILTGLADGAQVKRSVLITNLVFSLIAAGMNAGLVATSLEMSRGEVIGWTGVGFGAIAFNAGSAILSGLVMRSQSKPPVTLTPMVLNNGAGASLSLRW